MTVRSSIPRGRIKSISFPRVQRPATAGRSDCDLPWNEFTIVTAKDIRDLKLGENYVALILNDQPYLADQIVNHPEEPIVLLAHHDRYLLEEDLRLKRAALLLAELYDAWGKPDQAARYR